MTHLTCRVTDGLDERISRLAIDSGMSRSDLIRGCLLHGFSHYRDTYDNKPEGMDLEFAVQYRDVKPRSWNK